MNKSLLFIVTCLVALYCFCTNQPLAGGSSQQGNGKIIGCVVYLDGSPAKEVSIRICPENYLKNPLSGHDNNNLFATTTDINGRFSLNGLYPGAYTIEANNKVSVAAMTTTSITEQDSSSDIGTMCVKPYAKIRGSFNSLTSESQTVRFVQIQGLDRYTQVNEDGSFVFNDLPEGHFELHLVSDDSTGSPQIVSGVVTRSESTESLLIPSQWRFGHRYKLNTTATGADITGNVTGFPLLLRLTQDNFDFSQANSSGSDLRFTGKENKFFPFETEYWDKENKRAEIWVKVDTIYGNDSTQSIYMFWGNDAAPLQTNSSQVFDTSLGYVGVWHLNEKTGHSATDVSGNNYSGTFIGGLPNCETSFIGPCQRIEKPDSDYVDMGNVLDPGSHDIFIGVWIKRGSFQTLQPQALVSKTNGDLPSSSYGYLLAIDKDDQPRFYLAMDGAAWGDDSSFEIAGNLNIQDTTSWHYICVVIDRTNNSNCKMYLDGIDRTGIINGNVATVPAVSNNLPFHIGTESDNNRSFKGSIADVTISFTTRSSDWIKLSYMNQKPGDALIKW